MPTVTLPDGSTATFPDSMGPDEIKAVLRRKFAPPPDPNAGAKDLVARMNPIEGGLAAFGEAAAHSIRQVGNLAGNALEGLGAPRLGLPTDKDVEEAARLNAPLMERFPILGFSGGVAPTMITAPLGGGAGMATKGILPRALSALRAAAGGAAQGYAFSDPGQREENAGIGGALGGTVAAAAEPLAALARGAGRRASRMAVNIFEPDQSGMIELGQKYMRPGLTLEEAVDEAGAALRRLRGAGGKRAIDPHMTLGERSQFLGAKGDEAGKVINSIMEEADAIGLKGHPEAMLEEARRLKNMLVGGKVGGLTETDIRAKAKIDGLISRLEDVIRTKVEPGASIMGTQPAVNRPLQTPVRNAAGEVVGEAPTIAKNQVGAAAPDTVRVFDSPVEVGTVQGRDPVTKRFRKAEPAPQPHLQKSEVVEIPAGEMSTAEGLNKDFVPGQPGPYGYQSPKEAYLARNRAQPEFPASRPTGSRRGNQWYTPIEEVSPAQPVQVGNEISFYREPLSVTEAAKRKLQAESFIKKGSGEYRDVKSALADPFNTFERRLSGALRQHVEDRLPPFMRSEFQQAKNQSQLATVFGDMADSAAADALVRRGGTGGSLRGTLYRRAITPIERNLRPYGLKANELLERAGHATPKNMDALIRALMIQAAQQED